VQIGAGVRFGRNVVFNCRRVRIGDGVVFGDNVRVDAERFEIGDFGTVYDGCFFPGPGTLSIGHNFWLGSGSIVDAKGGTTIGNNVGIGAQSQLWTHMVFGDVLYGCRFHAAKPLTIGDDAWLVGHCLVSPVVVGARSLAMLGSVITRDMLDDHCYAGVPAADITEKVGPQFAVRPVEVRARMLQERLDAFAARRGGGTQARFRIETAPDAGCRAVGEETVFNVADRTYSKRGTALERELMRFLLPDAKFVPA
jgi:acetyltransferase-like isoleucine patch superfamily enzyme